MYTLTTCILRDLMYSIVSARSMQIRSKYSGINDNNFRDVYDTNEQYAHLDGQNGIPIYIEHVGFPSCIASFAILRSLCAISTASAALRGVSRKFCVRIARHSDGVRFLDDFSSSIRSSSNPAAIFPGRMPVKSPHAGVAPNNFLPAPSAAMPAAIRAACPNSSPLTGLPSNLLAPFAGSKCVNSANRPSTPNRQVTSTPSSRSILVNSAERRRFSYGASDVSSRFCFAFVDFALPVNSPLLTVVPVFNSDVPESIF